MRVILPDSRLSRSANPANSQNPANPKFRIPNPVLYACLYCPSPPAAGGESHANTLLAIAHDVSPRYEQRCDEVVLVDVSGLGRLLGDARAIGQQLRRAAAARGVCVHVAIAGTCTAALVLAHARPGLTIVEPGEEARALAPLPIGWLGTIAAGVPPAGAGGTMASPPVSVFTSWGLNTLGELAALPAADLASRLGRGRLVWQAIARGEDVRPLVPTLPEERFESSIELEWPIEGIEPLSFVLTRLLEPLSTRLERRDRGAAVLHVLLRLVTRSSASSERGEPVEPRSSAGSERGEPVEPRETHVCRLQLPAPIRDVRTLRTLALLDFESRPPPAAIDHVAVVIDPTPGRVLQHALFTPPQPAPEQIATLLARLGAVMGQDRIGVAAIVDSYRPGAFTMRPFATDRRPHKALPEREPVSPSVARGVQPHDRGPEEAAPRMTQALRRCRQPVPARVIVEHGEPVRVIIDRGGSTGGRVVACAGPWRTAGEWWADELRSANAPSNRAGGGAPARIEKSGVPRERQRWDRDEWDVALGDGTMYRMFCDRETGRWFIDAVVD
jgi:protein ImuB